MRTGKNDLKTLRVDADFFELNGRKKPPGFKKNQDTCGQGLIYLCHIFRVLYFVWV